MAWLPSGEMLITERTGRLRIVRDGVLDPDPITGWPAVYRERGQGGFMDVVPHPDFAHVSATDGEAVIEILRQTHDDFARWWADSVVDP